MANFRSFLPKQDIFLSTVNDTDAKIVIGTETWLYPEINDGELFFNQSFHLFRKDRTHSRGGGILIAISKMMDASLISLDSELEILWVRLSHPSLPIIVGACYRPPGRDSTFVTKLHACMEQIFSLFPSSTVIFGGDFNYPGVNWKEEEINSWVAHSEVSSFVDLMNSYGLTQTVLEPTRNNSVLDLVFTSSAENVKSVRILEKISDHNTVLVEMSLPVIGKKITPKTINVYSRVNENALNESFELFASEYELHFSERTVERNWEMLKNEFRRIKSDFVPQMVLRTSADQPWFTNILRKINNKKKRLYVKAKITNLASDFTKYNDCCKEFKSNIKKAKDKYYKQDLLNLLINNPQKFWKSICPRKDDSLPKLCNEHNEVLTNLESATVFNNYFASVFTLEQLPVPSDQICKPINVYCEPITFNPYGILSAIERLSRSSGPGDDEICPKLLKLTKNISCRLLCRLFQQSLDLTSLPADWRFGRVLPIFKTGNKNDSSNYRPISLTSVPCKIMEHVIYSHIMNYMSEHQLICNSQHGFRKGYSCETQLFEFVTDLHNNFHSSHPTDAIFIDFSKAFDTVPHQRLLYKLSKLNIHPSIIHWIAQFLSNRNQAVHLGQDKSPSLPVISGVPQGSVLGPLLFLIYINDLPLHITSSIRLFADDCVIYRRITKPEESLILQQDLNMFSLWCNTWQMKVNVTKSKLLTFTGQRTPAIRNYTLQTLPLEKVSSYKYLGVTFSDDLTWNTHINTVVSSACKSLGYIKRNLHSTPHCVKLTAYKSFVRAKLDYANFIWWPHQAYLINKLESVQNKASRFISHDYSRTSSVTALKTNLDLCPLAERTKLARLVMFHKIYYSSSSFRNHYCQPPSHISLRRDHSQKINPLFARTNKFQNSPLSLAINNWNSLPEAIALENNPAKFRDLCKAHLKSVFR